MRDWDKIGHGVRLWIAGFLRDTGVPPVHTAQKSKAAGNCSGAIRTGGTPVSRKWCAASHPDVAQPLKSAGGLLGAGGAESHLREIRLQRRLIGCKDGLVFHLWRRIC